jgi:hypothetical protein
MLELRVLVYSVGREFAPHPGLTVPAKGHFGGCGSVLVYPDSTELRFP